MMRKLSRRTHAAAFLIVSFVAPLGSLANPNSAADAGTFHSSRVLPDNTEHAWMIVGNQRHELSASTLRNAKAVTDAGGMQGSNAAAIAGSAAGVAAGSLGAVAAIPFVGMAAPLMGLFGHKPKNPTQRDTWALAGTNARVSVATQTPSFELSYDGVAGVNRSVYEPVLINLSPTSDNWRLVSQTERQFSSNGLSAPKFSEHRIPVTVQSLGRGHVRLTPQTPLSPGQYGITLRPQKDDAAQTAAPALSGSGEPWQSVWDFGIETAPPSRP